MLAEAFLDRYPMNSHVIHTMANIEEEENMDSFLEKYTTPL